MKAKLAVAIFTGFISLRAFAQGGPPMMTEAPATPGPGHFEINLAGTWNGGADEQVMEVPHLDIRYGAGKRVQLKGETGWIAYQRSQTHIVASGVNTALVGIKYRFIDQGEGRPVAVSTYPQVGFRYFLSSKNVRAGEPGTHFFLPLEFARIFGRFAVNTELGFDYVVGNSSAWNVGSVFAFALEKNKELLFEIHDCTRPDNGDSEIVMNFGIRYGLTDNEILLLSVGRMLTVFRGEEPVNLLAYLGLQLKI